jgi:hypothetical protein
MAFDVSSSEIKVLPRSGSVPVSLPLAPHSQTRALVSVPSFNDMTDAVIVRLITGWPAD